MYLGDI